MTKKVKEKRGRHLKPKAGLEPGTEKNVTDSPSGNLGRTRRTLLKKTGAATAALATWLLPKQWQKPVIGVVALPTHAQTSPDPLPVMTISADADRVRPGGSVTITVETTNSQPVSEDIELRLIVSSAIGVTFGEIDGDYFIKSPFLFGEERTVSGNLEVDGRARLPKDAIKIAMEFVAVDDGDTEPETVSVRLDDTSSGYSVGTIRQVDLTIDPRQPPLPVTTAASTTPAPRRPGAPSGLMAMAESVRQIDLIWNAPADDGNSPITGYRIQASEDGGISFRTLEDDTGDATTGYSHTGLTGGVTRHYLVFAINAVGVGAEASAMATTFPATVPGAPVLSAVASGSVRKTLTWTAPDDGGSPIIRYIFETHADFTITETLPSTARSRDGVQTVSYRVRAENAVGAGAWSALL